MGHTAINKCRLYDEIKNDYFVYTDPDVLPVNERPENFLEYFLNLMKKNFGRKKPGFH
ncbi:MAG: hypothetical protein LBC53_07170 [Spirochaetaceae bacterium]|nr:hypothetical protein [Spirochaetaceae bacterium]